MGDLGSVPGLGRSTGEEIGYPLQYSWASLVAQLVRNLPAMQENWVGKIPWRGKGNPLQNSGLENSMDCIVHSIAESDTTATFTFTYKIRDLQMFSPILWVIFLLLWWWPLMHKFLILVKSNLALFSIVACAFDVKQDTIALSEVMKVSSYVLLRKFCSCSLSV